MDKIAWLSCALPRSLRVPPVCAVGPSHYEKVSAFLEWSMLPYCRHLINTSSLPPTLFFVIKQARCFVLVSHRRWRSAL